MNRLAIAYWIGMTCMFFGGSDLIAQEQDSLSLRSNDRSVLTYHTRYLPSPVKDQPWYGRSGFIHPFYTPSGRVVTDAFPADHLHQHGLMFAWTSAHFRGHAVDFWNSKRQQGHVEHVETVSASDDQIVVRLRHVDDTGDKPVVVLEEEWSIQNVPSDRAHVFDLTSIQKCATEDPLHIQQYHYGAMCVRGASSWMQGNCEMMTSEGKGRAEGNHTRPRWVAMLGEVDGQPCGLAAIPHLSNLHAPQPVRLHPTMPYLAIAPMVVGSFDIEPGKPFQSRYRFVAFDGKLDKDLLDGLADDFSQN